jgi:hypothetical protein
MKLSHDLARTIELQIKLHTAKYDVDAIRRTIIGSFVEPRGRGAQTWRPCTANPTGFPPEESQGCLAGHLCSQLQYLVYATLC